jgi:CheY-like chemotaxis protein
MIVSNAVDNKALWELVKMTNDAIWSVHGGLSALARLKEIDYDIDVVVTDLAIDDIDGISLTEHIRRNESIRSKAHGCLIFWMSEHTINPTILKSKMELKVMEIFSKPMTPASMLARVKGYLSSPQAVAA